MKLVSQQPRAWRAALVPIETEYAGVWFRSRLEARWALFFDIVGVAWEYEPERFRLDSGTLYVPDFRLRLADCAVVFEVSGDELPRWGVQPCAGRAATTFAEVKPDGGDFMKAHELTLDEPVLLLEGAPPGVWRSWLAEYDAALVGYSAAFARSFRFGAHERGAK